jgi:catechol 2,3-dioxygenase-like lactoylglutathione lyase family enzyme
MMLRIELFVRDPRASAAFYERVLGFRVTHEKPWEGGYYVTVQNGGVQIGLGTQPPELLDRSPFERLVEIVLEVDDVETCYRHVLAQGYPLQAELQARPWGLRDFRLFDLDRNYLRVTSK